MQSAQQGDDAWLHMQAVPLELSRQPWMDLPDATLTPTQRAVLKEHDKKVQVRVAMALCQNQTTHYWFAVRAVGSSLMWQANAGCT